MHYNDYSYRHGKELLKVIHPNLIKEVNKTLIELPPFPHGEKKGLTANAYIESSLMKKGWKREKRVHFKTEKEDYIDLFKENVGIEMEFSRFEMFFRDFFRFMLLYTKKEIDVGIILTLDEMAYKRWHGEAKDYKAARASLKKLVDFLQGEYSSLVSVPLWCIGIE